MAAACGRTACRHRDPNVFSGRHRSQWLLVLQVAQPRKIAAFGFADRDRSWLRTCLFESAWYSCATCETLPPNRCVAGTVPLGVRPNCCHSRHCDPGCDAGAPLLPDDAPPLRAYGNGPRAGLLRDGSARRSSTCNTCRGRAERSPGHRFDDLDGYAAFQDKCCASGTTGWISSTASARSRHYPPNLIALLSRFCCGECAFAPVES
jgi:hypothetical protein